VGSSGRRNRDSLSATRFFRPSFFRFSVGFGYSSEISSSSSTLTISGHNVKVEYKICCLKRSAKAMSAWEKDRFNFIFYDSVFCLFVYFPWRSGA
jgi:hypothetical protein